MSAGIGALLGAGEGFIAGRQAKKGAIEYFNTRLSIIGKKVNAETLAVEAVTKDPTKGDVTGELLRAIDVDTEEGKTSCRGSRKILKTKLTLMLKMVLTQTLLLIWMLWIKWVNLKTPTLLHRHNFVFL